MPASRLCSECTKTLAGRAPGTKTCSDACRQKRARRLKTARDQKAAHLEPFADAVVHQSKDALHDVVKQELAPIVREAISDDVLRAIDHMMRLTPRMIELMAADMEDPDPSVRQKAYTLLARYTLGNQAVAPQPDAPSGNKIEVNFTLPRPGDDAPPALEAAAVEMLTCTECTIDRPASEFMEGSRRCQHCDAALRAAVEARFGS